MAVPDRLSSWEASEDWGAVSPRRPGRSYPARGGPSARGGPLTAPAERDARAQARRRLRLIRRRRLDLLQDSVLALILAVFVLVATAGLAVVALVAAPLGLALVASLVVERRRRVRSESATSQ